MICPACYGPSRISKTLDNGTEVVRLHECMDDGCNKIWTTDQKLRPGSLRDNRRVLTRREDIYAISNRRAQQADVRSAVPPPSAVNEPSAEPESRGGVGGGLPGGSDLALFPIPDPSRQSDQDESRGRAIVYHPEFLLAWESTAKTGSKFKAFEAWKRHGRPAANLVASSWASWTRVDSWRRGYVPHVVKWLNGRCWEQEPCEANGQALPEKAQQSRAGVGAWLAEQKGGATG